MLHRIASALALATVAGFLAAGPVAAADEPDFSGEGSYHSEGHQAGMASSNVGGPLGVSHLAAMESDYSAGGAYRFDRDFDHDFGFDH
ncbi:hypothetical protein OKJ48_33890 [Streptomyces kunmingensis]|uniref:Uncharacterized protein n=1 Tax=Streptomyces kunmingensis TaxID=68225 RepID=A0ABU6CMQ4_9ACTN|nr:hypothetical protein [Streptomyces kunmingensis]MEB3965180.1 hypothetical protein [Streptomyces kunmingensis]